MNGSEQTEFLLCCGARFPSSYQSPTGADRSGPPLARGLHRAEEMAGIPFGERVLAPVGAAVPPLEDAVARNQVMVDCQVERQRATPEVDLVVNVVLRTRGSQVTPEAPALEAVGHGVGDEASISCGFHRVDDGQV